MTWRRDKLPELVRAMSGRPRHEALRGHVTELLREGFGAPYDEIAHELYLLDNRGRIDTMWGATVIELKSDLRRELPDVLARMADYLADAARRTHSPRPVTGIATDGTTFIGYQLVEGVLTELRRYETDPERPNELILLDTPAGLVPLRSVHGGNGLRLDDGVEVLPSGASPGADTPTLLFSLTCLSPANIDNVAIPRTAYFPSRRCGEVSPQAPVQCGAAFRAYSHAAFVQRRV